MSTIRIVNLEDLKFCDSRSQDYFVGLNFCGINAVHNKV